MNAIKTARVATGRTNRKWLRRRTPRPHDNGHGLTDNVNHCNCGFGPFQGETPAMRRAGCWCAPCTCYGLLMIANEIRTGIGRAGKLPGMGHHSMAPDLISMATQ